jgi:regulator of sigma E protease
MILTTIILFLLILGVIVFFHELGHFFMAKLYGVKVDEFGIGFPPKIFGFKKGETEYSINWIPLGGFVKIMGEDGENKNDSRSFSSKSVGQRFQIISAGVIMNFVLAFIIFSFIFIAGFPQDITGKKLSELRNVRDVKVLISGVAKDSPAEKAGLRAGDAVLQVNGKNITSIGDLQNYTKENIGQVMTLNVLRKKETFTKEIVPRKNHPDDQGPLGVTLAKTAVISYSPLEAIKKGYEYTVYLSIFIIMAFAGIIWSLISTGKTIAEVSGPVGIAVMTQQAAAMGFMTILNFTALISVNLAIINILPFPALDGGRLLFLIVEKIKGAPINQQWEAKVNNVGFMLLIGLMIVVTFKDFLRFDVWGKAMGLFG